MLAPDGPDGRGAGPVEQLRDHRIGAQLLCLVAARAISTVRDAGAGSPRRSVAPPTLRMLRVATHYTPVPEFLW